MKKLIVGNLKSNMNMEKVGDYIYTLNNSLDNDNEVVICPSYIYIPFFTSEKFIVGAQNVSIYDSGSYTGEVSAEQLKSARVKYVIIGHSERRKCFHEGAVAINRKIKKCIENDLIPIVCVGETKEEKIEFKTKQVLRMELLEILKDLDKSKIKNIVIAYEPIWSIGTGIVSSPKEIDEIALFIKDIAKSAYKIDVKVLYGGSVNTTNIDKFKDLDAIDGFLIGSSSNSASELSKIANEI